VAETERGAENDVPKKAQAAAKQAGTNLRFISRPSSFELPNRLNASRLKKKA